MKDPQVGRCCFLLASLPTTGFTARSPGALVLGQSCRAPFAQSVQPLGRVSPRLVQQDHAVAGVLFRRWRCWAAPQVILVAFAINLLYQFWIHARWIPKLGFLEGIINTPSAHRVHHAVQPRISRCQLWRAVNFDRLFGTYIPERDDLKPRYGWVKPLTSNKPAAHHVSAVDRHHC